MRFLQSSGLVLLFIGVALAGCVSSEAGDTNQVVQSFSESESGGVILGTVVDSELNPLAGVLVAIDALPTLTTDEAGRFRQGGLEPGDHKVIVQALGYTSIARQVSVAQGASQEVQFILEPLPVQEPYTELFILKGYSICDISLVVWITIISPCPLGTPIRFVVVKIPDSWRYGVVEMKWTALESFILYTSLDQNCNTSNQCFGAVAGRSPLRLEMAPDDEEIAKKYAPFTSVTRPYPEGKFKLQSNVIYAGALQKELDDAAHAQCVAAIGFRFGCPGVGISAAGLPFTKYITIFHWERPVDPASFTAIPDG